MKADLRAAHLGTLKRAWIHLRAVELDLQVLGSEFGPDLHQINAQLYELRQQMQHDRLDNQGSQDSHPEDDSAPMPTNPDPAQNGGEEPDQETPGQTMKHSE